MAISATWSYAGSGQSDGNYHAHYYADGSEIGVLNSTLAGGSSGSSTDPPYVCQGSELMRLTRHTGTEVFVGNYDAVCSPGYAYRGYYNGSSFYWQRSTNYIPPPVDADSDGVLDNSDLCPDTPAQTSVDVDGCSVLQLDCSDGLVTQDENGYDCGGLCGVACGCPVGSEQIVIPNGEPTDNRCAFFTAGVNGICPPDYIPVQSGAADGKECYSLIDGFGYAYPVNDLPDKTAPSGFIPVIYNSASTSSSSTVDNGDGTSTRTTTETAPSGASGGSSVITTTTETINNTTGEVSYVTINESATLAPEDDISNFDMGGVPLNDYDPDITDVLPEEQAWESLWDGFINTSPLFAQLATFEVQTSGAVCSVNLGHVYDIDLIMDVCDWQDDLLVVGALLLSVVQMLSFLVIYRGWK